MKKIIFTILLTFSMLLQVDFKADTIPQLEDGVLNIGTNCEYAPFEYTVTEDNASEYAVPLKGTSAYCEGYDMQWATLLADELGVDLEVQSMAFDGLIPALQSGSVDLLLTAMSPTPERREEIDFTDNYYDSDMVMSIVTTVDGDYADAKTSEDFAGANIATGMGTSHGAILETIDGINVADPLEGADTLMQATKAGTIDGYMTEHEPAAKQAASDDQLQYVDLTDIDIDPGYSGYAMAVKQGDDGLVTAINDVIAGVSEDDKEEMLDVANSGLAENEQSEIDTSSIEQLADGTLTIGTDCAYAPYAFSATEDTASKTAVQISGNSGYCDGYDIMIGQKVADYLGVDFEVKVISFDGLIPALDSGQIDAIIAGMSATPDRLDQLDFSNNYFDTNLTMSIVLSSDSKYADATDSSELEGASISSQLGTFHGDFLPQIDGIEIASPMESVDVLMQAAESGMIDGYITEHEAAAAQADSTEALTYIDLNDLEVDPGYSGNAIGIKKGSDEFTGLVNSALDTISDEDRTAMMDEATAKDEGTYEEKEVGFLGETWNLFLTNKSLYADGIKTSLILALFGTIFGAIIGFVLVAMRIQEVHYKDKWITKVIKKLLSTIAVVYIDIIRGTPMMVQAMLFFYGLAANIMEPNTAGIIIISFNTAAYVAEILRGGINSLDKGQMEAGRSLGLTNTQTFVSIIVPQTLKNTLPALANQLVLNVKDSSVLSVIAVSELFYATKQAASAGYMYTQAYFISALIYLVLTIVLTRLLMVIMRRIFDGADVEKAMTLE